MIVELTNKREIDNMLKQLPRAYEAKFVRKTISFSTNPMLRSARMKAPKDVDVMAKSLGKINMKRAKFVTLIIGPRVKGAFRATRDKKQNRGGWYANFVEYGTAGFTVKKDRVFKTPDGNTVFLKRGTKVPGQAAQPFMRPAWDEKEQEVKRRFFDNIKRKFELEVKRLTKKGVL